MHRYTSQYRVLCFGHDPLLLETRSQVLATRYQTTPIHSVQELESFAGEVHLLVLCHSLSAAECVACSEFSQQRWPGARIVMVAAGEGSYLPHDAALVVPGLEGPVVLLNAVQQALAG